MSENVGLLEHTERFFRAKRNLMFWLGATILVECTHTNAAISPEIFGAALSINPRVLSTLLFIVSCYHALGFFYERRIVQLKNNVLTRSRNVTSPEALVNVRFAELQTVTFPLPEKVAAARSALRVLHRDAHELQKIDADLGDSITRSMMALQAFDPIDPERVDLTSQETRLALRFALTKVKSIRHDLNLAKERFATHAILAPPVYLAIQKVEDLENQEGELSKLLAANVHDLRNWHETVSVGEVVMFRWYDTVAPATMLIVASLLWLYDLGPWPSPGAALSLVGT